MPDPVLVVRTLASGDTANEWLSPAFAVLMVLGLLDDLNGSEVISARILWDGTDARQWDTSA